MAYPSMKLHILFIVCIKGLALGLAIAIGHGFSDITHIKIKNGTLF